MVRRHQGSSRCTEQGEHCKCQGGPEGCHERVLRIGKVRAAAIMDNLGIAASRRVRGLGVHQRRALVDFMNEK